MGMSQICTGDDHYFRPSKLHSGKLCDVIELENTTWARGRGPASTPTSSRTAKRSVVETSVCQSIAAAAVAIDTD